VGAIRPTSFPHVAVKPEQKYLVRDLSAAPLVKISAEGVDQVETLSLNTPKNQLHVLFALCRSDCRGLVLANSVDDSLISRNQALGVILVPVETVR